MLLKFRQRKLQQPVDGTQKKIYMVIPEDTTQLYPAKPGKPPVRYVVGSLPNRLIWGEAFIFVPSVSLWTKGLFSRV
jgi:hypothetical protein